MSNPGKNIRGVLEVEALSIINAQLASMNNILQNLALWQGLVTKAPLQATVAMTQTHT